MATTGCCGKTSWLSNPCAAWAPSCTRCGSPGRTAARARLRQWSPSLAPALCRAADSRALYACPRKPCGRRLAGRDQHHTAGRCGAGAGDYFLLTIPLFSVNLPFESAQWRDASGDYLVVSVDRVGKLYFNDSFAPDIQALPALMGAIAGLKPQPELHIRADANAPCAFCRAGDRQRAGSRACPGQPAYRCGWFCATKRRTAARTGNIESAYRRQSRFATATRNTLAALARYALCLCGGHAADGAKKRAAQSRRCALRAKQAFGIQPPASSGKAVFRGSKGLFKNRLTNNF